MNWNPVTALAQVLLELAAEQGRVEVTVSGELARRLVAKGYDPRTGRPLHWKGPVGAVFPPQRNALEPPQKAAGRRRSGLALSSPPLLENRLAAFKGAFRDGVSGAVSNDQEIRRPPAAQKRVGRFTEPYLIVLIYYPDHEIVRRPSNAVQRHPSQSAENPATGRLRDAVDAVCAKPRHRLALQGMKVGDSRDRSTVQTAFQRQGVSGGLPPADGRTAPWARISSFGDRLLPSGFAREFLRRAEALRTRRGTTMSHATTAQELFEDLQALPATERGSFSAARKPGHSGGGFHLRGRLRPFGWGDLHGGGSMAGIWTCRYPTSGATCGAARSPSADGQAQPVVPEPAI